MIYQVSEILKKRDFFLRVAIIVCSFTLAFISLPRLLHHVILTPVLPIMARLDAGEVLPKNQIAQAEKWLLQALDYVELPETRLDLGAVYLAQARIEPDQDKREKHLIKAINAFTKGLEKFPIDTYGWSRLATAYTIQGKERSSDAVYAWRRAIQLAEFDPFSFNARIHLGIILFPYLDADDQSLLRRQLKLSYIDHPPRTLRYAQDHQLLSWLVFLSEPGSEQANFFNGIKADSTKYKQVPG